MRELVDSWWGVTEAPFTRAELYDAAAYGADPLALRWLLDHFDILSRPRAALNGSV